MPRIRSVHPGLWTDERFASVSPLARLLFIGIWTECDDAGSFEWSPIKLKMRLLPADAADAGALLEELAQAGCIIAYEIDGRKLGAVRNFTKFQRPKKPNSTYPQTDQVRNYCGYEEPSVPNQFPTASENSPQMEDGGWRMEDGGKKETTAGDQKPRAGAADAASSSYAFEGRTIRLTEIDLARWRKSFAAIPDLEAELTSLDAWFDANPPKPGKWFQQAAGALSRKCQELSAAAKEAQPAVPL